MATNTATIANGGTTSPTVTMEPNRVPIGIVIPAAFTGTTLTFEAAASADDTPVPLYNESTLYSLTVAAGRYIALNPNVFASVKYLRVVSGSVQSADRNLVIVS